MGNACTHVVLRGGSEGPNYDTESVSGVRKSLDERELTGAAIVIDCSHGNSGKDYKKQRDVLSAILNQTPRLIRGFMLESNIMPGSQTLDPENVPALQAGVSITDGCIGMEETKELLERASRILGE